MKKNNSHGYGFKPLDKNISHILKPIFTKKKDHYLVLNNLTKNWQKIIGEKCWQFCFPKKITFEKNKKSNAILTISAGNSSIGFYLESSSNQIVENIAIYFGYKIVKEIRIVQEPLNIKEEEVKIITPLSAEKQNLINKSTNFIKDEGLRSVLQKIGESIISHQDKDSIS
ncbi:MAG: hypothetical protein ACJAZX_000277 [Rickettsiales bacterium]|jgi:hypothetical protein